jgi:hypothetical protein
MYTLTYNQINGILSDYFLAPFKLEIRSDIIVYAFKKSTFSSVIILKPDNLNSRKDTYYTLFFRNIIKEEHFVYAPIASYEVLANRLIYS